MTDKILTLKEAEERGLDCWSFDNGDYIYKTEDSCWHLIRNGVDLLKDKKAIYYQSYPNGDFEYKTEDEEEWHKVKNPIDN